MAIKDVISINDEENTHVVYFQRYKNRMYFCKELNVHIYIYTCVHDGVFVSSGDFFWIFYVG